MQLYNIHWLSYKTEKLNNQCTTPIKAYINLLKNSWMTHMPIQISGNEL